MEQLFEINLDVSKQPTALPVLYLGQGDSNATEIQARIYDNGIPLELDDCTVRFSMALPDGSYYSVNGTNASSMGENYSNLAIFHLDETYAARVDGITEIAYVEILDGETVIASTNRFVVSILESAEEGADPSSAYSNGINEAIDRAIAAAEAAEGAVLDIVPLMSETTRGGAKVGSGLEVDSNGFLNLDADVTLPLMTPTTRGGAKLGSGLEIDTDGKLNVTGGTGGGDVTGVKGDAETNYRKGDVNLTPANIGAAPSSHTHAASDIASGALPTNRGGTGTSLIDQARATFGSFPMLICDSEASARDKVVYSSTVQPDFYNGVRVCVKFTNGNTYASAASLAPRLSYSESLACPIYIDGAAVSTDNPLIIAAGEICDFLICHNASGTRVAHYLGKAGEMHATQSDLDTAENDIAYLQNAVGNVDTTIPNNDLQSQVSKLGESVSWTLIASTTGTTEVALPSGWREVYIKVFLYDDNQSWLYLPKVARSGNRSVYELVGLGAAISGSVKVTDASVSLVGYSFNGNDRTSTANVRVYCR